MHNETTKGLLQLYINEKKKVLDNFPIEDVIRVTDAVWKTYLDGGTIYACGNGGNAAYVSNMLTDFSMHPFVSDDKSVPISKNVPRLKVYHMVNEGATLTALLNDIGPEYIFSQQLINNGANEKDLIFGFSGRGNSGNVLEAFHVAKDLGLTTVAITRGSGGKSKDLADYCVVIPGSSKFPGQIGGNDNNFHFEDSLSSIPHMITGILRQRITDKYSGKQNRN